MSDDFFDFDDEFGVDHAHFFDEAVHDDGVVGSAGPLPPLPSSAAAADSPLDGWTDGEGGSARPARVAVRRYLPNVSEDAFPVVVSVLAQANLGVGVDLRTLSCATRNVEYIPNSRNACATMRLHEPSAVVLVRNSGALTIVGAAGLSEARQAAELAARVIRKAIGLSIDTFRFRVRSIMARFNACSPIRLDDLAHHSLDPRESVGVGAISCVYEPERFNGCVVRLEGTSERNRWVVTTTVFVTGKISMLGARSLEELRFAFDALIPILGKYIGGTGPVDHPASSSGQAPVVSAAGFP
ncbi:unnamed protein product [Phytomonas sp. EM1]|nr:unnamed protein product [Phytomonas sp. EM1]|eukprot:CCW64729.1 unnamed protein product [Phytomonas sp. isolate EM1]